MKPTGRRTTVRQTRPGTSRLASSARRPGGDPAVRTMLVPATPRIREDDRLLLRSLFDLAHSPPHQVAWNLGPGSFLHCDLPDTWDSARCERSLWRLDRAGLVTCTDIDERPGDSFVRMGLPPPLGGLSFRCVVQMTDEGQRVAAQLGAAESSTKPVTPDGGGTSTKQTRTKWLAEAMFLVREHPDWADSKIAKEVGIHRSQLTARRCPEYQAAAKMARGDKNDLPRGNIVSAEPGKPTDVEAQAPKVGDRIPDSRCYRGKCPECGEDTRVESPELANTMPCERCR